MAAKSTPAVAKPREFPFTYKLKRPVKVGEEELTELVFHEPTGEDMAEMPVPIKASETDAVAPWTFGQALDFAARCADVPPSTTRLLKPADVLEVVGLALGFIGDGPPTGASA